MIAAWLLFVVGLTVAGGIVGTRTLEGNDANVGESARANDRLKAAGLDEPAVESLMISSGSPDLTRKVTADLRRNLERQRGIASVSNPYGPPRLIAGEGRQALVRAKLRGDPEKAGRHAPRIEDAIAETLNRGRAAPAGPRAAEVHAIGPASVDRAIDDAVGNDLRKAELFSIPLTLVILVLAFGALVAASVPLILGVTSVLAAMGGLGLISQLYPVADTSTSLIVLLGLAVGVDYSLFYIRREREERRRGSAPDAALAATAATVGRAIVIAGLTVVIGLSGLLITGLPVFMSMALGTMLVVLIAVIGSLTVLPATLALLGDRIDRGRLPFLARLRGRGADRQGFWGGLAGLVTKRPAIALTAAGCLLASLAVPALEMKTGDPEISLPADSPIMIAQEKIEAAFPGSPDSAQVVISGHGLDDTATKERIRRISRQASEIAGTEDRSELRVSSDGGTAAFGVDLPAGDPNQSRTMIHRLRDRLGSEAKRTLSGADLMVTGGTAAATDFADRLGGTTPVVVGVVLLLALMLVFATFRSIPLAIGVVGLNLASIGATCGITTAVFQQEWAEGFLDFTSSGTIVSWVPLFAFVILFGLSMDYTILVLERIREYRGSGLSPRDATRRGIGRTAGAITSAAAVMVAVFSIFAVLPMIEMKMLGVALSVGILLDATLVRGIALPAMVASLGDRGVRPAGRGFRAALAARGSRPAEAPGALKR